MACARMNRASKKEGYSSAVLTREIEFHNDLGCTPSIFGSFIAHPPVGSRNREPEERLRIERAKYGQNSYVRDEFHFVALELAGRCFDALLSPGFYGDAVQARLVAQQ